MHTHAYDQIKELFYWYFGYPMPENGIFDEKLNTILYDLENEAFEEGQETPTY